MLNQPRGAFSGALGKLCQKMFGPIFSVPYKNGSLIGPGYTTAPEGSGSSRKDSVQCG